MVTHTTYSYTTQNAISSMNNDGVLYHIKFIMYISLLIYFPFVAIYISNNIIHELHSR